MHELGRRCLGRGNAIVALVALATALMLGVLGDVQAQPKPGPSASASALVPPAASASVSAAPPPSATPPPPAISPEIALLQKTAQHIRDLLQGKLALSVDPATLFDVDIANEQEVAVEARRLGAVIERADRDLREAKQAEAAQQDAKAAASASAAPSTAPPAGSKPPPAPKPAPKPSATPSPSASAVPEDAPKPASPVDDAALQKTSPALWEARIALDRARLSFYRLSSDKRTALITAHRERQKVDLSSKSEKTIAEADRDAAEAEKERQAALEAAREAHSEAERAVHEEHARLLDVTKHQAEYSKKLASELAAVQLKSDEALGERRKITETIARQKEGPRDAPAMDLRYDALRKRLKASRAELGAAISQLGDDTSGVPLVGDDPLRDVPAAIDRSKVDAEREHIQAETTKLLAREVSLKSERARLLMAEVDLLNRARLEMLPFLSTGKRSDVTGFGPEGLDQASSELTQVWLTVRYHLRATSSWVDAIRTGDGRSESAWTATIIALKWLVPALIFFWWRRRSDRVLSTLRANLKAGEKPRRGAPKTPKWATPVVSFIVRVHKPLEWLLLLWSVHWLLPDSISSLLEVELVATIFSWTLGGTLVVNAIDALSSDDIRGPRRAPSALQTAHLRLRSLRVVGRAVVTVGLILSLSNKLVGKGTIYSWVFSTCWFAAIPILLFIVSWWRPVIFERLELIRKKGRIENWVLANREGPASPVAAVVGGTFMFATGVWRVLRGWVVTFTVTRRVLAYLFRRDMSKKASKGEKLKYQPIKNETFLLLGPETPSDDVVPSVADEQVKEVIQRIAAPGGGIFAIVGERGAGKTTLLERIAKTSKGLYTLPCPPGGIGPFLRALNDMLEVDTDAEIAVARGILNDKSRDNAVLIDDAHQLIRPMMEGLRDFDEVLELARTSSAECTWVFAIDDSLWRFLEQARGAKPLFDAVIHLEPWSEEGIVRLLTHRSEVVDIDPTFDNLMGELPADADEIDRLEALQRTEANYYRLLWDYAAGNPGVALHFWRKSLGVAPNGSLHVRLFEAPDPEDLQGLPDATVFVLRAIVQLGWADVEQICEATALPAAAVKDALRYGSVKGYFEHRAEGYHITWAWFRAITRFLQRRHLLFSR